MARVCLDYGHGGIDSGACYMDRKESDDVLALGKAVALELRRHAVIVDETRTADVTVSLEERSAFENRNTYDYFISFHRNAYQPEKAEGVETYTYITATEKSKPLAEKLQESLVELGFTDRGVKQANFHVLRETKAPAVLVEIGFIDNSSDNSLFDLKLDEIIKALAKAILTQLNIDYIEPTLAQREETTTLYRVMVGSYLIKENAEKQVQKLKSQGFDAVIMPYNR